MDRKKNALLLPMTTAIILVQAVSGFVSYFKDLGFVNWPPRDELTLNYPGS